MIVVDVGAARYGGDYSMERLIDQFNPTHLYAFDPNPALELPDLCEETRIELHHAAAWRYNGTIGYRADGLNSWLTNDPRAPQVPCVDLAHFILGLSEKHSDRIVLKLDCEGCEYDLLAHLIARDVDELLDLIIVEWHPKARPDHDALYSLITASVRCEIREWPY
jgi:FkbM family methyltransferase